MRDYYLITNSDCLMETQSAKIVAGSKIQNTFTGFFMHEFIEKSKRRVAEGNCLVLQYRESPDEEIRTYLKMNNFDFCKLINSSLFVRVIYEKSTTFIFFNEYQENLVYSISAPNISTDLAELEKVLKYGNVVDYTSAELKYEIKIRIDFHIDEVKENEVMITFNRTAKVGKVIGNFFGKISQKLESKSRQADRAFLSKVDQIGRESFSQETRTKWNGFKEKASEINQKLAGLIKPIGETFQGVVESVGKTYQGSENQYVKSFRQFTLETQNSINDGYIKEVKPEILLRQSQPMNDTYQQMKKQGQLHEELSPSDYPAI